MAGKTDRPLYTVRRTVDGALGYNGRLLDLGQAFAPDGIPGDERLERLGFIQPLVGRPELYACSECGAEFAEEPRRRAHGDRRHRPVALDPREEDRRYASEERMLEQTAPLYLDKTAAALR